MLFAFAGVTLDRVFIFILMKHIVMLQGMGNNESGWARLASKFGRVTLIQLVPFEHVEIWENGHCISKGPESSFMKTRPLDEMIFSALTIWRGITRGRKQIGSGKADVLIAASYGLGLAALWLRWSGRTQRVVALLTDYLPPRGSWGVCLHRRITSALMKFVVRHADEVWTVSPRIPMTAFNARNFVVPICLDDNESQCEGRNEIGYVGFPSPDHALDILFEICKKHRFRLNIIGDSPYLQSIKHLAPDNAVFHGVINDPAKVKHVISRCFCGYAVYRNTGPTSYSYYGIPSKTFYYFASNTPVVTSLTAHFTANIEKFGVGRVVEPTMEQIEKEILQLQKEFSAYFEAINVFRKNWNAEAEQFHYDRMAVLMAD